MKTEKEILIMRYLDDALNEEELLELNKILKEDAEAREFLYCISEQSVILAGKERSKAITEKPKQTEVPKPVNFKIIYTLAALLTVAFTLVFTLNAKQDAVVVKVTSVTGTFKWLSDDGTVYEKIDVGTELPSGSIEATSEQSSIKLVFKDKTRITLFGHFSASISEEEQKKLNLYKGLLAADVNPQPKGRPFIINTPTAQMEVLGTKFNIDSTVNNTLLSVSEGAVKLTRKVDASGVKVKANEAVLAANKSSQKLIVKEIQEPVYNWQSDFANAPTEDIVGQLIYIDDQAFVKAAPREIFDKHQKRKLNVNRVGHKLQWRTRAPLMLKDHSKLRIKGRMDKAATIDLFFLMKEPKGDFAGNFYKHITPELDEHGNFEIVTGIDGFRKLQPWSQDKVTGLQVYLYQMYTAEVDVSIMASSMEIITAED
ncbi:MAG: FecR family protein [Lentisphaerales bacterium]|nr:FecR family protein [Lentisphaerales bacterium]